MEKDVVRKTLTQPRQSKFPWKTALLFGDSRSTVSLNMGNSMIAGALRSGVWYSAWSIPETFV